jgi:hypothetical protein
VQLLGRGVQADACSCAQVLGRIAEAAACGAARYASQELDRCVRPVPAAPRRCRSQQEKKNSADTQRRRVSSTHMLRLTTRVSVIMTVTSCSAAVASRPPNMLTTSGFQRTWVHSHSTRKFYFDGCSRLYTAIPEGRAARSTQNAVTRSHNFLFRLGENSANHPIGMFL